MTTYGSDDHYGIPPVDMVRHADIAAYDAGNHRQVGADACTPAAVFAGAIAAIAAVVMVVLCLWTTPAHAANVTDQFSDVDPNEWYVDDMQWVVDAGIMKGYGESDLFGVGVGLTRAEMATVVANAAGVDVSDETEDTTGIPDLAEGGPQWYTGACNWAVANGIFTGCRYEDGTVLFNPNDYVTREQAATVLYRWAQTRGANMSASSAIFSSFPDANSVSDWAQEAFTWIATNNIITGAGRDDGIWLDPARVILREEICKVVRRTIGTIDGVHYGNGATYYVVTDLNTAYTTNKIALVTTTSTSTSAARFQYFERISGRWNRIIDVSATVGQNGIDKVQEGDRKTPTGLYRFTMVMGIADNPGTILPYTKITNSMYWCGGVNYYNQFIDESRQEHNCDKRNDEHLIDYTNAYQYLAAFDFNADNVYGKGSAIFLHCMTGSYTAGCVGIPYDDMKEMMHRIDTDTVIIIDLESNISNARY